ncbi:putative ATP-dependent RNA helicase [uncultured archaeon]|nr:putative ATP-dependent RNA helicase [uncultured archaeon]
MENFRKLGISEQILKSLQEHNFEKPSEIQELTIPLVLQGKDVIAGASTGSGKTLAFGSAILQNTKRDYGLQSLVLTPTRELAEQISKALNKFSKHNPLNIIPVYGGVSINPQIEDLESAEVVVGTPGRILDHLQRGTIELKRLKILVLDEADRMLDMGFKEDVEKIISQCPENRQTLLFSATISEDISRMASKFMKNPEEISAEQYVDPTLLTQVYYDIDDGLKFSLLVNLLEHEDAKLVMVFCNTRKNVDFVANNLKSNGIDSLPIHGGFSQEKRNKIMEKFHSQKVQVLVCTDVAARGLDIKGVSHVYNYNIPLDNKEYVHRIGRTARAGKEGKVINLVSSRDYDNFRNVLKDDEIKIKALEPPYIDRINIKWLPERRPGFGRGTGYSSGNYRGNNHNGNSYRRDDNRDRPHGSYNNSDRRPSSDYRRDSRTNNSNSEGNSNRREPSHYNPRRDSNRRSSRDHSRSSSSRGRY